MKHIIFAFITILCVATGAFAGLSAAKYARLVAKGEKIALKLCDEKKLDNIDTTLPAEEISAILLTSDACAGLNRARAKALSYFLKAGGARHEISATVKTIEVPQKAKCPVCGMFVAKYPKWAAEMVVGGKSYYFDGVKDMMKFYFFDGDFPYDRNKIERIMVTDFYTLRIIDARKAFYVVGSDVYGPMGNELIPFDDKSSARNFLNDHKGEKILLFDDITPKIVMALDGIEYNE